jgi:hypothetical protein
VLRAAIADPRRWVVLVDDAPGLDDVHGVLAGLLAAGRPGLHVIAAGRSDALRGGFGHWSRPLRQSRAGVLLRPDLATDGDLLGVRLPRRVAVGLTAPGRGFVVDDGDAHLAQLAGTALRTGPRRGDERRNEGDRGDTESAHGAREGIEGFRSPPHVR